MNHPEPTHQSQIKARDVALRSQSAWMCICTHTGVGHLLEGCHRRFVCFKRLNTVLQLCYHQDLATGEPGLLISHQTSRATSIYSGLLSHGRETEITAVF